MSFWQGAKRGISAALAAACFVGACLFFRSVNACKLSEISGERSFYLYSASSQARIVNELTLADLSHIKGESVRFILRESPESVLQTIVERYDAQILFSERVGGVVSYYCYTEKWGNALSVGGEAVNLHIAFSDGLGTVGTPIVFGGF
ncbi:MAG: YwmB family TATA-box binding protein [Clostridia bacterium]|nr:YwmB family TATA-box binding protein [Clostridia bacterium]